VADAYGFASVEKFCGHGVGRQFHMAPYVQHFRNRDQLVLEEGMVFTIEPMLCEGSADCFVLDSDGWTVHARANAPPPPPSAAATPHLEVRPRLALPERVRRLALGGRW
jgi:methionine aminopeptidase